MDQNKIHNTLWKVDREEVRRLPIDIELTWHYSRNGEQMVKSGYHLAQAYDEAKSHGTICGLSRGLQHMWKMKIPNKVKIHNWHILFNAL